MPGAAGGRGPVGRARARRRREADATVEPEILHQEPVPTAVIRRVVPVAAPALHHGPPADTADLEIGFPTDRAVPTAGDVVPGVLPGGRVARVVHAGGYDGLGAAWGRLGAWVRERELRPAPVSREVYLTGPTPDADPPTCAPS